MKRRYPTGGFLSSGRVGWRKPKQRRIVRRRRPYTQRIPRPFFRNVRTGGALGIEMKYQDTTYALAAISATWAGGEAETNTYGLICPDQGAGASQRDGNQIIIKSIMIRGHFQRASNGDNADCGNPAVNTLIVVLDTQTNGAQLAAEHVMVDAGQEAHQFRNLLYRKRFRVLARITRSIMDVVAFTDGANTGSCAGNIKTFEIYRRVNIPVNFVSSTPAVADIADNSIHVICAGAASDLLTYQSRVRYVG